MPVEQELSWLQSPPPTWDELPLGELQSKAAAVHKHQDSIRSNPSHLQLLKNAVDLCRTLVRAVERAGLFSANEEGDDLATADLKYLLASYYLAELLASSPAPSGPTDRHTLVQESVQQYSAFLQRCQQYELLGPLAKRLYTQEEDTGGQLDATTKRAAKIERFKADKQIKTQLELLERQKALSKSAADDQDDAGPLGGSRGWDEEDERVLWQTVLQQAALNALGQRDMLREEVKLLEHAIQAQRSSQPEDPRSRVREEVEQQQKQEVLEQLRKIAVDLGTASTVNRRQQLAAEVFRPSHILPTMTLDELAAIEVAEAQAREQAEHSAREAEARRKEALGDEEDEEELRRQRAWDDWKDRNPSGWGNSKTKPCH